MKMSMDFGGEGAREGSYPFRVAPGFVLPGVGHGFGFRPENAPPPLGKSREGAGQAGYDHAATDPESPSVTGDPPRSFKALCDAAYAEAIAAIPGVVRVVGVRQVHGAWVIGVDDEIIAQSLLLYRLGETADEAGAHAGATAPAHRSVGEGGVPHGRRGALITVGEGDALVTALPGVALVVRTADCVPVLAVLLDAAGVPRAIGAAHAGWRGILAGVVPAMIQSLGTLRGENMVPCGGSVEPQGTTLGLPNGWRVVAVVGPCISAKAFQVGADVADRFAAEVAPDVVVPVGTYSERPHVDCRRAVHLQLERLGVVERHDLAICTVADAASFSFRRERDAVGSMSHFIVIGDPTPRQ